MRTLVADALEQFAVQALARKIILRAEISADVPPVSADRDRVIQVLSNLLANALQFTPEGGHTLRQAVAADIPGIQRVRMSVRENRLVSTVITDRDVLEAIDNSGRGWVVESGGEIVAFAVGNAETGNIWALFVHPLHERRGYGRRLHDTMLDWLWSQGLERLWLTTEPGTRAQTFYEAAGWQPAGRTDRGELRYEVQRPSR